MFVTGDFNIGYQADKRVGRADMPVKTFGRLGMGSMWATELPTESAVRTPAAPP